MVTVNGALNLNEFDLPGIFSNSICENDGLREKLMPLCHCREQINITDIPSLCRFVYKHSYTVCQFEFSRSNHFSTILFPLSPLGEAVNIFLHTFILCVPSKHKQQALPFKSGFEKYEISLSDSLKLVVFQKKAFTGGKIALLHSSVCD